MRGGFPGEATASGERRQDDPAWTGVQAGESEFPPLLVEKYHRQLLNFIYRLVGDKQIVEDIGQEVFLNVYRSIRDFDLDKGTPSSLPSSPLGTDVQPCAYAASYGRCSLSGEDEKKLVEARSVFCFFVATELETTLKDLAVRFAISGQAVNLAVERGRRIAEKKGLKLTK